MLTIIIAAVAKNGVIGKDGKIPWHSKEELKHFKNTTTGFPVIMGRKTFESIGKPLKQRLNIVITSRNEIQETEGELITFNTIKSALDYCERKGSAKVFIIGGGKIYNEALRFADRMIITEMDIEPEGDVFFPPGCRLDWELTETDLRDEFTIKYYNRKK